MSLKSDDPDLPPEPPDPTEGAVPEPALAVPAKPAVALEELPAAQQPTASAAPLLDLGPHQATYRVVRRLGEGGMAEVFLAHHVGAAGFERAVAIKRIPPAAAVLEDRRRMFLEEARLVSQLHHPDIAQVHALFEHDGAFYLVMEYVPGRNLRELLLRARKKGRCFSPGFGCYVVASVADALAYAHLATGSDGSALNIVHRDVSPHNVMVTETGNVKLLDFGIAMSDLAGRERTAAGFIKGKFAYMSPEQAVGDVRLDGRSDLFALGILLVELLTGRCIFDAGSEPKTLRRVTEASPEDIDAAIHDLAKPLQAIIRKALARDREERYSSGTELSRALRSFVATSGHLFDAGDAVEELGALEQLPDASEITKAEHSPSQRAGDTADEAPRKPGPITVARRNAAREAVYNPKGATPRALVKPLLVLGATAILGLVAVKLVGTPSRSRSKVAEQVVKTPAQEQAERAAAEKNRAEAAIVPHLAPLPEHPPAAAAAPATLSPPATVADRKAIGAVTAQSAHRTAKPAAGAPPPATPAAGPVPAPGAQVAAATPPVKRLRSLISSTATQYVDARPTGGPGCQVAKGTYLQAKLTSLADPNNPGPVSAEVTQDVAGVGGCTAIAHGSTVICTTQGLHGSRVSLTCDTVNTQSASRPFKGTGLGTDKLPGLPVRILGKTAKDDAESAVLEVASKTVSVVAPKDGVAGQAAAGATTAAAVKAAPRDAVAFPAPRGTAFLVFVQETF